MEPELKLPDFKAKSPELMEKLLICGSMSFMIALLLLFHNWKLFIPDSMLSKPILLQMRLELQAMKNKFQFSLPAPMPREIESPTIG